MTDMTSQQPPLPAQAFRPVCDEFKFISSSFSAVPRGGDGEGQQRDEDADSLGTRSSTPQEDLTTHVAVDANLMTDSPRKESHKGANCYFWTSREDAVLTDFASDYIEGKAQKLDYNAIQLALKSYWDAARDEGWKRSRGTIKDRVDYLRDAFEVGIDPGNYRRRPWTPEEDSKLIALMQRSGQLRKYSIAESDYTCLLAEFNPKRPRSEMKRRREELLRRTKRPGGAEARESLFEKRTKLQTPRSEQAITTEYSSPGSFPPRAREVSKLDALSVVSSSSSVYSAQTCFRTSPPSSLPPPLVENPSPICQNPRTSSPPISSRHVDISIDSEILKAGIKVFTRARKNYEASDLEWEKL